MHYHAEIYLKELKNVEEQIERILHPYNEHLEIEYNEEYEYWRNPNSFWDWYQIGGRWTGVHTNYNPEEDERNIKKCDYCNGTGFRNDKIGKEIREKDPSFMCNSCKGKGKRVKWPTQWALYGGDIISVDNVKSDLSCYTLIINDKVFHTEDWDGNKWGKTDFNGNVKDKLKELGIKDGFLVTVDYHN